MTELNRILISRAERIEHRSDGDYIIFGAADLSAEEFQQLIMENVRRLQSERAKIKPLRLSN